VFNKPFFFCKGPDLATAAVRQFPSPRFRTSNGHCMRTVFPLFLFSPFPDFCSRTPLALLITPFISFNVSSLRTFMALQDLGVFPVSCLFLC